MPASHNISSHRRTYNKLVANEMMEDFALRFTSRRARKWPYSRIANTALGIVSFMVLEAIGGAITLSYGFVNAAWAIVALIVVVFISGTPISYYAARYGVDIDLLSRGAGFGYAGSTIASLVYASFTFIFFALEAAIMSMALELLLGIPLYIGYAISALIVLPLVSHGIAYISRFQAWSQPVWVVLQLIPLFYVFHHPESSVQGWFAYEGEAGSEAASFNILLFGAASAVLMSLVAQIGEQADFLRFLPPKGQQDSSLKWWAAVLMAGPGWIVFGAAKLFLGSILAFLAIKQGLSIDLASDPAHIYELAFGYVFNNTTLSILVATLFVVISQLKINVANAYAGSLAWSNFFCRITHNHPGRVIWMVFNVLIALLLMELGIYQTIENILSVYSVVVLSWLGAVSADLLINKPLGISPAIIEFKRAKLFDVNPVGVLSMSIASAAGFIAYTGVLGNVAEAMASYLAFALPFISVPLIGVATGGRYYLVRSPHEHPLSQQSHRCCICENTFDYEDMTFCPLYQNPICSLCCSLDVHCGDKCREGATLAAQLTYFIDRFATPGVSKWLGRPLAQSILLTLLLSGISAVLLSLVYWQITAGSPGLQAVVASALVKVFFFLLIIIGVVSWLLTLAKQGNRLALGELRLQTDALAEEVSAHEKTSLAYQQAKDEAESANNAKSRYLAGLSHELRTPLNVLLGYAQLLANDGQLPTHVKGPVLTMKRNGEHLNDLIEGVLEVSKIEAGRLSVNRDEIELHELLEQLLHMFDQQASGKGLTFNYEVPKFLPRRVSGDKQRLRQILINLISNAIKFTDKGSVSLRVSYRNEVAHFTIEDTGPGISQADQEKVFQPFERVSPSHSSISGTGLGLTISRALAELMGGDITLYSEPGQGSQFHLKLLLPRLSEKDSEISLEHKQIVGYEGNRKTILVIDDDLGQRQLLNDILSPIGFNVITADSAYGGMQSLTAHNVDLILLDLNMASVDGWQAARNIRDAGYVLPIIIVSANVRDLDTVASARRNHNDYLVKPFVINQLLSKVGQWLSLRWEYQAAETTTANVSSQHKPDAGPLQFRALKSLAEIGYLSGFVNKLNDINDNYQLSADVRSELKQLAAQCQFQKAIEKIDVLIANGHPP
ncbi:ATP-binding protein [Methylophaga thalassica]|nr:ATP-binding protein [Methylophaga aminisulfidivorans]